MKSKADVLALIAVAVNLQNEMATQTVRLRNYSTGDIPELDRLILHQTRITLKKRTFSETYSFGESDIPEEFLSTVRLVRMCLLHSTHALQKAMLDVALKELEDIADTVQASSRN